MNGDPITAPSNGAVGVTTEDRELVLAFKRGEDGSYQAIYDRYHGRVRGICSRLLNNPSDADEAKQETFMRVYTGLGSFNGRYQLGAWVSRIATNVCLDQLRSKKRHPADSVDHDTLISLQEPSDEDSPEQLFIDADDRKKVRSVLASLSPMHRAAIALREFEGMSYADIALALGMTEPQVKALIHRARKSFRRSWMQAGLAAFLPWRTIARIRRAWEPAIGGHHSIADAAATSTVQFSNACSTIIQQCGQFVTEKVAPIATAVIFGGAAVATNMLPADRAPEPKERFVAAVVAESDDPQRSNAPKKSPARKPEKKKEHPVVTAAPEPAAAPAPPAEEPEPDPEPAPSEDTDGARPDDDKPAPAGPAPVGTLFGWDRGSAIPKTSSTTYSTKLDCTKQTFTHSIDTWISDGSFSYRAIFNFYVSGATGRIDFHVWANGSEVRYASWGAQPVVTWSADSLAITGEYGPLYGQDPSSAKLPTSGRFDASLTLDCAAQAVVTEGARFTAE